MPDTSKIKASLRDKASRKGCDRKLETPPPAPDLVQVGWYCSYHRGEWHGIMCHNPLDCDVSPMWALPQAAFNTHWSLALNEEDEA
jgi:hypothetical protein